MSEQRRIRPVDPGAAEGGTAPAHRGLARARHDVRAGRAQPGEAAVPKHRRGACRLPVPGPAVVPGPVLRRRRRAAHRTGFLRPLLGLPAAREGGRRGAYGDLLRSADPYRARHPLRNGARRTGGRTEEGRGGTRHQLPDHHVLSAAPVGRGSLQDAGAGAAACGADRRRRPRFLREGQSAVEFRAGVRRLRRARLAPGRPRGRGGSRRNT